MTKTLMESAKELITQYYASVEANDWEGWMSFFDDNIVMDYQLTGYLKGIETIKIFVEKMKEGYSAWSIQPLHVVAEENKVSVIWQIDAKTSSGESISARGANFYHIENGKILRTINFHDTVPFEPDTAFHAMRSYAKNPDKNSFGVAALSNR